MQQKMTIEINKTVPVKKLEIIFKPEMWNYWMQHYRTLMGADFCFRK